MYLVSWFLGSHVCMIEERWGWWDRGSITRLQDFTCLCNSACNSQKSELQIVGAMSQIYAAAWCMDLFSNSLSMWYCLFACKLKTWRIIFCLFFHGCLCVHTWTILLLWTRFGRSIFCSHLIFFLYDKNYRLEDVLGSRQQFFFSSSI